MVEVNINVGKKEIFVILLTSLFFGSGFVVAYNALGVGGNPSSAGHSVDEMDFNQNIPMLCLDGWCVADWGEFEPTNNYTNLCVNGNCITNWNQARPDDPIYELAPNLIASQDPLSCDSEDTLIGYYTTNQFCVWPFGGCEEFACNTGNHSDIRSTPQQEGCFYQGQTLCISTFGCAAFIHTVCQDNFPFR